jgi:hypothetical protein
MTDEPTVEWMAARGRFPLEDVAATLGVTRQTISNRVAERQLPEWKIPHDRRVFVVLADVTDIPTRRTA